MRLDRLLRTLSQYVRPAPTRTETRGTTAAMMVETILTIVRDLDNPLHGEVRRARFGPASGLALAVRPAGLAEVSSAQGRVLKIVSAKRLETIFGCP